MKEGALSGVLPFRPRVHHHALKDSSTAAIRVLTTCVPHHEREITQKVYKQSVCIYISIYIVIPLNSIYKTGAPADVRGYQFEPVLKDVPGKNIRKGHLFSGAADVCSGFQKL
jgi:hypothetical protein